MDDSPVRYLIAFVLLLLLSGYFAGSEIALASVNKMRLLNRAEDGDKKAKRVLYILDNFDKALTTILIGNNIAHIAFATLATLFTYTLFDGVKELPSYAVTLCTVVSTVIVFFLGEMIPKSFAKACNESFAYFIAGSLIILMKLMTPISFVFSLISKLVSAPFKKKASDTPTVTEDELYEIIETYVEENDIDKETEELVQNAIEFSESTVKDVMTPWDKVICINENDDAKSVSDIIQSCTFSRLPVVNDDGDVVGTLRVRSFLKRYVQSADINISDIMANAEFIADSTPVDDVLSTLSSERTHIAYVKSGNQVIGIITVEDILEELVGEIYDEEEMIGGEVNA